MCRLVSLISSPGWREQRDVEPAGVGRRRLHPLVSPQSPAPPTSSCQYQLVRGHTVAHTYTPIPATLQQSAFIKILKASFINMDTVIKYKD